MKLELKQTVFHRDIYDGKEPMKVVGIRETEVELEGDYSGGTHNVCQKSWHSIDGVIVNDSDLQIVEITLTKYKIKFHKLIEDDTTYIMPFKDKDIDDHIYVQGYGLVKLTKSCQFSNFMEFCKGSLASY
jgi:hypothetical protein